jgi:chaperone protein EcpD
MKHPFAFDVVKALVIACAAAVVTTLAQANVLITGTRVIYPAKAREVTVKLDNPGTVPALLQVWIDDGDASNAAQQRPMPFTLTPPVFRIDPSKGQMLRLTYTKEPLPADRESVYWLNMLEIPPKPANADGQNLLQMAIRTRIKVFFRPEKLEGNPNQAPAQLTWQLMPSAHDAGQVVAVAKNPTPFHVNVANARVEIDGKTYDSAAGMVEPRGQHEFVLKGLQTLPAGTPRIRFTTINDYGAVVAQTFPPEDAH